MKKRRWLLRTLRVDGDEPAHEVVLLHRDDMSVRAVALSLGLDGTVRRLLAGHEQE